MFQPKRRLQTGAYSLVQVLIVQPTIVHTIVMVYGMVMVRILCSSSVAAMALATLTVARSVVTIPPGVIAMLTLRRVRVYPCPRGVRQGGGTLPLGCTQLRSV